MGIWRHKTQLRSVHVFASKFFCLVLVLVALRLCYIAPAFSLLQSMGPEHTGSVGAARGPLELRRLTCPWDLSSPASDGTCVPCLGRWLLDRRTTRAVP